MSKTSQITQLPLEAVPDAIVVVDGEGQIIQVNTQTEKLFGYSREELLGRSVEMLIPARLRAEHIRHRTDFFTHPSVRLMGRRLDLWGLSKDGQEFPVEISLSPFEVKGELLVTAAIRDISERNRTEETIQILLRISEKLNSIRNTDKLLDNLIQEAIGLTHAESGCAGLRASGGMVSQSCFQGPQRLPLEYCWPPEQGLPGWLLVHKVPYLTNDAFNDPQTVYEVCVEFGIRSMLSTPILDSQGEVIGFFEVYNKRDPSGFTLFDQALLMAVSHSAAIALQNALAYEAIKQAGEALRNANHALERRVQERTTELAKINEALQAEITERQQTETALRESKERFRQLVEHLDEVFWMSTADGSQVLYVSPAYEKVRGHPCQRLYEHPTDWIEAIHPEDRRRLQDIHARIVSGEFSEEYRIIRPDGVVRWIWSRGFPIHDPAGHIYRIAGIAQDITERKQAEEKLRQQQAELAHIARFALAGEMASGLAHELNQPLGAIKTYTEVCLLLIGSGNLKDQLLIETLEKVAVQAQRAGEIIQRLRNLVRKAEPRRNPVNINELIQEVIHLIAPEARQQEVQLRLELDKPLPLLFADAIQIQQVVLNLVRNAIEAMGESRTEPRVLTLRAVQIGSDALEVTVSDTGSGLSSEEMEGLFMPFFTTKPTGMGLGLSISQSIIRAHKGRLWVTANADRGVTFHFILPYELRPIFPRSYVSV